VASLEILARPASRQRGPLANAGEWTEKSPRTCRAQWVGELTDRHWVVIKFMRKVHEQEANRFHPRITQKVASTPRRFINCFPTVLAGKPPKLRIAETQELHLGGFDFHD